MDGVEDGRDRHPQYVVLSRACANLYGEMAALVSAWPGIEVVVDRRHEPRSSRGFLGANRLQVEAGHPAHPGMKLVDSPVDQDVWGA